VDIAMKGESEQQTESNRFQQKTSWAHYDHGTLGVCCQVNCALKMKKSENK